MISFFGYKKQIKYLIFELIINAIIKGKLKKLIIAALALVMFVTTLAIILMVYTFFKIGSFLVS